MKKKAYFLIVLLTLVALQAHSQDNPPIENGGVHWSEGVSYDSIASSNIGSLCEATGLNSFAGGWQSLAQGSGSFAFGNMAQATQPGSFALGGTARATASTTMSLGFFVTANQNSSIVIGSGVNSINPLTASVAGIMMGMGSTTPTLYLSTAPGTQRTGKVAIGNVMPQAKLHIRSDNDEDAGIILVPTDTANSDAFIKLWDENHYIEVNSKGTMDIRSHQSPMRLVGSTLTLDGKVGVNTTNDIDGYALAVDGGVITTKVYIQDVEDWHDEVFGEDYRLMTATELKEYLVEHRHLPGIPSEAEVKANGYDVAVMQAVMLEKIEELTLHMLRQQEELDSLRTIATVRFGYDDCGNRISRTLEFARINDERNQASLCDRFAENDALLFPNPTEGGFMLSLTGTDIPQDATATLCTIDGKVVEARVVSNTTEEFDLTGRPSGIYLLRLASERETKVWKVIKRR